MDKQKAIKRDVSIFLDFSEIISILDEAWQANENIFIKFNGKKYYSADLGQTNKYSFSLMRKWGNEYDKSRDPSAELSPCAQRNNSAQVPKREI
jgi:hypothetical protein